MTDALRLIACARAWLGTPYRHQAGVKGVGADCVGFLKTAAVEAGVITPELAASLPTDYSRQPAGGELRRLMGELLVPIRSPHPNPASSARQAGPFPGPGFLPVGEGEQEGEGETTLRPGDLLLIRFAREDQHVAMLTEPSNEPYIIHCGMHGVVEHRLDSVWTSRVTRIYRFRGLE